MSADTIVSSLVWSANHWRWIAVAWHILLGALVVGVIAGWRPTVRRLGQVVTLPLMSVTVLSWLAGSPFNGTTFAILGALLVALATRFPRAPVRLAQSTWKVPGALLIAFGWMYPHFLTASSWTAYAYASPFGILPCPTLSVVIGITLLFANLNSIAWCVALFAAGLLYGVIGLFTFGVVLDVGLLTGSMILAARLASNSKAWRSVRAEPRERIRRLPGDEFIPKPGGTFTHAITIRRSPRAVWPWLIQMGAGTRAGWYSYDFLDNARQPSATRIVPELQHVAIGALFPALPGVVEGFNLLAFEPNRSLILGWLNAHGAPMVTWAFVLEERGGDSTRLIVRVRGGPGYRFHGLPPSLSKPVVRLVHFVMERRQLLGIAGRVESPGEPMLESLPLARIRRHRA